MTDINSKTLSEQIYSILRDDIINHRLQGGEKLKLSSLKHRFKVSSTPIREALTRLMQEGLVNYQSNIGTSVIQLSKNDARELYQLKADLDILAMKYSFEGPDKMLMLSDLGNVINHSMFYKNNNDYESAAACSDKFHLVFYRYCNNSRLEMISDTINCPFSIFLSIYNKNHDVFAIHLDQHRNICDALVDDDFDKASRLFREHMLHSYECVIEGINI